jgi:hypothetical protein
LKAIAVGGSLPPARSSKKPIIGSPAASHSVVVGPALESSILVAYWQDATARNLFDCAGAMMALAAFVALRPHQTETTIGPHTMDRSAITVPSLPTTARCPRNTLVSNHSQAPSKRGADVQLDFNWDKPVAMTGYR